MAPVVSALRDRELDVTVLATGQHSQMLDQALAFFEIRADVNLSVMEERQPLDQLTSRVLLGVGRFLDSSPQDLLLVHGDTTTTMAAAMAAFYRQIPVGHVEAGLRSGDLGRPFPEEANRIITDRLSTLWFAPTEGAAENLRRRDCRFLRNPVQKYRHRCFISDPPEEPRSFSGSCTSGFGKRSGYPYDRPQEGIMGKPPRIHLSRHKGHPRS